MLGYNRTITRTNINVLINIGPGARGERKRRGKKRNLPNIFDDNCKYHIVKQQIKDETTSAPTSFPAVLGDIICDVTCQACRKHLPRTIANWPGYEAASVLNVINNYSSSPNGL